MKLSFKTDEKEARAENRPHVAVRVFVGPADGQMALAGTLRFRLGDEWDSFKRLIKFGTAPRPTGDDLKKAAKAFEDSAQKARANARAKNIETAFKDLLGGAS